ncbi:DoxX family protein [Frateuria aurantia]
MNNRQATAPLTLMPETQNSFNAPRVPWWCVSAPTLLALVVTGWMAAGGQTTLDAVAVRWMLSWFLVSTIASWVARRRFVAGFLIGLLTLLAGWRIAGPTGIASISVPAGLALLAYLARLADAIAADLARGPQRALSPSQWQLTVLRIYVAFDMVPHFTEKLFAGAVPFHEDSVILAHYGMSHPALFVLLGGLCELGVAIGLGLGILTRLAAAGAVLYYVSTSLIGHHFSRGFIWNLNGGGWEYPMLMIAAFGGFIFTGAGRFSIDHLLVQSGLMPKPLQRFCSAISIRPQG